MIKAVLFDVFGVLYPDTYWSLVRKFRKDGPSERLVFHDLIREVDLGLISRDEFWDSAAKLLGLSRAELDREVKKLGSLDEDLMALAKELRGKGYKTGIISNVGLGFIERIFTDHKAADYFDTLVLSSEVGLIKPDPGIYRIAADRLDIRPEEAVFVDDLVKNVEGAKATGMRAFLYRDPVQLRNDLAPLVNLD